MTADGFVAFLGGCSVLEARSLEDRIGAEAFLYIDDRLLHPFFSLLGLFSLFDLVGIVKERQLLGCGGGVYLALKKQMICRESKAASQQLLVHDNKKSEDISCTSVMFVR